MHKPKIKHTRVCASSIIELRQPGYLKNLNANLIYNDGRNGKSNIYKNVRYSGSIPKYTVYFHSLVASSCKYTVDSRSYFLGDA